MITIYFVFIENIFLLDEIVKTFAFDFFLCLMLLSCVNSTFFAPLFVGDLVLVLCLTKIILLRFKKNLKTTPSSMTFNLSKNVNFFQS